ncbi:TPA: glycosyltransferase family 2 protein [Escherichia coli]|nr:glycosyltransferase family 2 protein [Escherichia coli]
MKNPLITIIVASYNSKDYIRETLESCINQQYQNIEIIIVDDYSSDNSVEIIKQWCKEKKSTFPKIRCILIENERNKGIPANLNNALPYINGAWVKCIGSDDILLPEAISEFVKRLEKYSDWDNIGAVFTYFQTFGRSVNVSIRYPSSWTRTICQMPPSRLKKAMAMIHFNNVAPCAFINKNHFNGFDTSYKLLEDLPLWLKMINNDINTLFFDYTTVLYRLHESQITSLTNIKVNDVLLNDLCRLNYYRKKNGRYLAYLHHKFNLYCVVKRIRFYRYFKIINPLNLLILLYERVMK